MKTRKYNKSKRFLKGKNAQSFKKRTINIKFNKRKQEFKIMQIYGYNHDSERFLMNTIESIYFYYFLNILENLF